MTIWETLPLYNVSDWVADHMRREMPSTYALVPPDEQIRRANAALERLGVHGEVSPRSSALRIIETGEEYWEKLLQEGLILASELDQREWFYWEDLSDEERPASNIIVERISRIDGLNCLGPGGRLSITRLHDHRIVLDVVARPRDGVVDSYWRDPGRIGSSVDIMAADAADDSRLRAAFGYEEASGYERQQLLRPVFVFLLDRPSEGGPGWRVATSIPATYIREDGSPAEPPAGMDADFGDYGCV